MNDSSDGAPSSGSKPERRGQDIFLSYNSCDREAVLLVRGVLQQHGITTFFDRESLIPGLPWVDALERALGDTRAVAVFLGRDGLGSWQKRELWLALDRQAREEKAGRRFPVLPVLLPGTELQKAPGFLLLSTWVDLRQGVQDTGALGGIVRALQDDEASGAQPAPLPIALCPYQALRAFREEDAPLFFGRDEFADQLLAKVSEHTLVAVVGASGSGKSSIVQAGLLPRLRRERPPAPSWDFVVMTPGRHPFHNLAAALLPLWDAEPDKTRRLMKTEELGNQLHQGKVSLQAAVDLALRESAGLDRLLVVIDQFEELFTLASESDRSRFVRALLDTCRASPLRLVLTLRADFYGQAISINRDLSDLIQAGLVNLGPMRRKELQAAIERPAQAVGLGFEPGLVDRILDHVEDQPGNLPLLEFCLTELWEARQGQMLGNAQYDRIGEVEGAISTRAEALFHGFGSREQAEAMRVLSRLVRVSAANEEGTDTRQRVRMADLSPAEQKVVQAFISARLLVIDRSSASGEEMVEVSHEALIRGWDRLKERLDQDRDFLLWRQRLGLLMAEWRRTAEDPRALLHGIQLAEAVPWLKEHTSELNTSEQSFITRSITESRKSALFRRSLLVAVSATGLMLILASLWWWRWTRSDAYQLQQMVEKAPLEQVGNDGGNVKLLRQWSQIMAIQGRAKSALSAAQGLKSEALQFDNLLHTARYLAAAQHPDDSDEALRLAVALQPTDWDDERAHEVAALAELMSKAGRVDWLLTILDTIRSHEVKSQMLVSTAEGLARAGDPGSADVLSQAQQSAAQISSLPTQGIILVRIAQGALKAGHTANAKAARQELRRVLGSYSSEASDAPSFLELTAELAELDELDLAMGVLRRVLAPELNGWSSKQTLFVSRFSEAMARKGRTQEILEVANAATHQSYKDDILTGLALGLCKVNPGQECSVLVVQVRDEEQQLQLVPELSRLLRQNNKPVEARKLLVELTTRLHAQSATGDSARRAWDASSLSYMGSMGLLVQQLVQAGEYERATALLRDFPWATRSSSWFLPEAIASALAKAGEVNRAKDVAEQVKSPQGRLTILLRILVVLLEEGDVQTTREFLSSIQDSLNRGSLKSTEEEDDLYDEEMSTSSIYMFARGAVELARAGMLEESFQLIAFISSPQRRDRALAQILVELEKKGKPQDAARAAAKMKNKVSRSEAFADAVVELANLDRGDRLQELLTSVEYSDDRSRALAAVARWQGRQGKMMEAVRTAEGCTSPTDQLDAYTAIMNAYVKRKLPHLALLLEEDSKLQSSADE